MSEYLITSDRDRWILDRRPRREALDASRPYRFLTETETGPDGSQFDVATVFLTNRECPFRCVMCDLWRNTLEQSVPPGAIPQQIRYALKHLPPARHIKLYNAGSFFDPGAIPPADYPEIARLIGEFERVIVESHPSLVARRCVEFRDLLRESGARGRPPQLEVAMGLETANPEVLSRLNKRMTLETFGAAASKLADWGIDLRVFILVRPPWMSEPEGVEWARRSLDFAFDNGASVCTLIPTRGGNGAMEALAASGQHAPPSLAAVEASVEYGLSLGRGRVFADLWDIRPFASCPACAEARIARLAAMNRAQAVSAPVECRRCG